MPIVPAVVLLALVILLGFLAACHFFQGRRHRILGYRPPALQAILDPVRVEERSRAVCFRAAAAACPHQTYDEVIEQLGVLLDDKKERERLSHSRPMKTRSRDDFNQGVKRALA